MVKPEQRLEELGLCLPEPGAPLAAYVPVMRSSDLLHVSGQLSADENGIIRGRLGDDMEIEQAQIAARNCALAILAQIAKTASVPLEKISRIVKLSVFVASTPDFHSHHLVANGASELLVAVLGEKGKHARAAFGVAALPLGAAVEVEAIVEVLP